jgi:hypothetical protein
MLDVLSGRLRGHDGTLDPAAHRLFTLAIGAIAREVHSDFAGADETRAWMIDTAIQWARAGVASPLKEVLDEPGNRERVAALVLGPGDGTNPVQEATYIAFIPSLVAEARPASEVFLAGEILIDAVKDLEGGWSDERAARMAELVRAEIPEWPDALGEMTRAEAFVLDSGDESALPVKGGSDASDTCPGTVPAASAPFPRPALAGPVPEAILALLHRHALRVYEEMQHLFGAAPRTPRTIPVGTIYGHWHNVAIRLEGSIGNPSVPWSAEQEAAVEGFVAGLHAVELAYYTKVPAPPLPAAVQDELLDLADEVQWQLHPLRDEVNAAYADRTARLADAIESMVGHAAAPSTREDVSRALEQCRDLSGASHSIDEDGQRRLTVIAAFMGSMLSELTSDEVLFPLALADFLRGQVAELHAMAVAMRTAGRTARPARKADLTLLPRHMRLLARRVRDAFDHIEKEQSGGGYCGLAARKLIREPLERLARYATLAVHGVPDYAAIIADLLDAFPPIEDDTATYLSACDRKDALVLRGLMMSLYLGPEHAPELVAGTDAREATEPGIAALSAADVTCVPEVSGVLEAPSVLARLGAWTMAELSTVPGESARRALAKRAVRVARSAVLRILAQRLGKGAAAEALVRKVRAFLEGSAGVAVSNAALAVLVEALPWVPGGWKQVLSHELLVEGGSRLWGALADEIAGAIEEALDAVAPRGLSAEVEMVPECEGTRDANLGSADETEREEEFHEAAGAGRSREGASQ